MSFSTIIFILCFLGAIIGLKKAWMGGIAGLLLATYLFYFNISFNIIPIVIGTLFFYLLGLACGFVCAIIFSGLKGKRHDVSPTYIGGFGAHHPGGIILSDGERKMLKHNDIKRKVILSY